MPTMKDLLAAHNHANGCCGIGPCGILEPGATDEEIAAYIASSKFLQPEGAGARFNSVGNRWSSTVLSGGTSQGDPVVITYSFVPDGVNVPGGSYNSAGPSNLHSTLDGQMGRPLWKAMFRRGFSHWSQRSGVRYVEVSDDGAAWGSAAANGSRGDVRIYGIAIPSGTAAYNYYPGSGVGGDMVVDTSYGWNDPANQHIILRNMVQHENGHGMGLGHVTSSGTNQLMEPTLSYAFDGGQDDDVRGMQRQYGDTYERRGFAGTGHNNTTGTATDLGTLNGSLRLPDASINNAADVDFYKFTLATAQTIDFTAAPQGSSYAVGNQGASESTVNTLNVQNLTMDILNSGGSSIKAVNAAGAGSSETTTLSLAAGTYYVKIDDANAASDVQLYTLSIQLQSSTNYLPVSDAGLSFKGATGETLQFDGRGSFDTDGSIASYSWDMNGDGVFGDSTSAAPTWVYNSGGSYAVCLRVTDNAGGTNETSITVTITGATQTPVQTLSSVTLTPNTGSLNVGATLQFSAQALDQSGQPMTTQPAFAWSCSGGTVTGGLFLAGLTGGSFSVTATTGGKSATAGITVIQPTVPTTPTTPTTPSAAVAIPATIQAEDYRNGGEGYAFHDTTPTNLGGLYRTDAVDVKAASENGYHVGWTEAGEWVSYDITSATGGSFDIVLRISAPAAGAKLHVEIDGTTVGGSLDAVNTGDWQKYADNTVKNVNITAGAHVLKVYFETAGMNFSQFTVRAVSTGGTAGTGLPSKIEAENYRSGGSGVGYSDTTPGNSGGQYKSEDVDIESCSDAGGGYNVSYVRPGEWLAYNVTATNAGTVNFGFRVSAIEAGRTFYMELDGVNVTGTLSVPKTNTWQTFSTVTASNIAISAGAHTLKLVFTTGYTNANYITITNASGSEEPANAAPLLTSVSATPNQAATGEAVVFFAAATDADGDTLEYLWDFGDGTTQTGAQASHAYVVSGSYTVSVVADDLKGGTDERTMTVVVSGDAAQALTIQSFRAGLNLAEEGEDSYRLAAAITLPDGFVPAQAPLRIDVGGLVNDVQLDAKGRAKFTNGSVQIRAGRKGKQATMSVKLAKTQLLGAFSKLAAGGVLTDGTVSIPVRVTLDETLYTGSFDGTCKVKAGKSAKIY